MEQLKHELIHLFDILNLTSTKTAFLTEISNKPIIISESDSLNYLLRKIKRKNKHISKKTIPE